MKRLYRISIVLVSVSVCTFLSRLASAAPVQQAYIKASNTDAGDGFGYAVAISGDTMVVSTPYEQSNATGVNGNQRDNSAQYAGAAYVFVRSGTNWTQQAYLKASDSGFGANFGSSVAVSGDTIVIGAPFASDSGAAYVFVRNGTNWTQQAYLTSNTGFADEFGYSVAVSSNTVVVGAFREASNAGAAYVFVRSGTTWMQQARLTASNGEANDEFGLSVAVSGNTVDPFHFNFTMAA